MAFKGYVIVFIKKEIKTLVKASSVFKKTCAIVIINKYRANNLYKTLAILWRL